MKSASIIIVSGAPAAGKSKIAKRLSTDLNIPALSKDIIKEQLFDSLGYGGRTQSRKFGQASFELLMRFAMLMSTTNSSFILDSAFRKSDGPLLEKSLPTSHFIQIYCHAEISTLQKRFKHRVLNGSRHPGHADDVSNDELLQNLETNTYGQLTLAGKLYHLDTNDFDSDVYENSYRNILRELV